jgi:hypothetical protein
VNDITWLRIRLTRWGRLCRAMGIGYPTMSSHEKARVGRGGVFDGPYLPDDVAEVDSAVAKLQPQHKLVIVEYYTKSGTVVEHAAHLSMTRDKFYRRKNLAENRLNTLLRAAQEGPMLRAG